jgi:polyribonucleotide nucleotidyltransferase
MKVHIICHTKRRKRMSCRVKIEVNNKNEIYEIDKVAKQANGAVLLREKDAVILATVAYDDQPTEEDFLPLTVQYVEKSYAVAKIPGGFFKRETRPGDFETLTSRIIDRSLRPLFPKGYTYPTQITVMVLSGDFEVDLQTMAINAASAALFLSDIPVNKNVASVRIGKIDNQLIINPTQSQLKASTLDLFVSGTKDELLMIEMKVNATQENELLVAADIDPMMSTGMGENIISIHKMNELSNDEVLEALSFASEAIKVASLAYTEGFTPYKKEDAAITLVENDYDENILAYIEEFYADAIKDAINQMAKSERAGALEKIAKTILLDEIAIKENWEYSIIYNMVNLYKKRVVRAMILEEGIRADGRGLKEVRDISIETNILPSVHSSCLFTRGQTQALIALTLGNAKDAQQYELLTSSETQYENFMVHYNFPGFSVGEASMLRAAGRRELGHGNLAKRAIEPSINISKSETIRIVSEVLESNGSSSMATVCGGSLALKAANLDVDKLVAGVAMGLVVEEDKYAILTDIMGLVDHDGDMVFKIAGPRDGITALQMDIKLGGIDHKTLKEAIYQASEARDHILSLMEQAAEEIELNENALPSKSVFSLDPSTFGAIIGQAGKNIKEIIEKFEVSIDLDRDSGEVKVEGVSAAKVEAACDHIKEVASARENQKRDKKPMPEFKEGQVFDGVVKRIVDFGAFVELPGGVDGLLHISKLSDDRVEKVTDIVNIGDKIKVKILAQKGNKIELGFIEKV